MTRIVSCVSSLVDTCVERAHSLDMTKAAAKKNDRRATAVEEALPRWVPVGERLPTPHRPVLVTGLFAGEKLVVRRATYVPPPDGHDVGAWYAHGLLVDVLAWQPLPAPWVAP